MLIVIRVVVLLARPNDPRSHTATPCLDALPSCRRDPEQQCSTPIMRLRSEREVEVAGLMTIQVYEQLAQKAAGSSPDKATAHARFLLGKWECTTTTKCSMPPARADTFPCSWQRRGRLSAGFSKRACPRAPDNAAAMAGKSGSRRSILWNKTTLLKQKRPS